MSSPVAYHLVGEMTSIPPQSDSLGPAGFFPWAPAGPENTFSEDLLNTGYCESAADVGITDEWATCLPPAHYQRLPREAVDPTDGGSRTLYYGWLRDMLRREGPPAGHPTMLQELQAWQSCREEPSSKQSLIADDAAASHASASHRLARALRSDLAAAARKQPAAVKAHLAYDAPVTCPPDVPVAWLASDHAAHSLDEWAAAHERPATASAPPYPPSTSTRRDVLAFLCARRPGLADAARMVVQWELTRGSPEPQPVEAVRAACSAGVAEALRTAFGGLVDELRKFEALQTYSGLPLPAHWSEGVSGDSLEGWLWHCALAGQLHSQGLLSADVLLAELLPSFQPREAKVPVTLIPATLPLLALLAQDAALSQTAHRTLVAAGLQLLAALRSALRSDGPDGSFRGGASAAHTPAASDAGVAPAGAAGLDGPHVGLAELLDAAATAGSSQRQVALADACLAVVALLRGVLAACPLAFVSWDGGESVLRLAEDAAVMRAVDDSADGAAADGPCDWAALAAAVRRAFASLAAGSAQRKYLGVRAMQVLDDSFPDAQLASTALASVAAENGAFRGRHTADVVAWVCTWACGDRVGPPSAWTEPPAAAAADPDANRAADNKLDSADPPTARDSLTHSRQLYALAVLRAVAALPASTALGPSLESEALARDLSGRLASAQGASAPLQCADAFLDEPTAETCLQSAVYAWITDSLDLAHCRPPAVDAASEAAERPMQSTHDSAALLVLRLSECGLFSVAAYVQRLVADGVLFEGGPTCASVRRARVHAWMLAQLDPLLSAAFARATVPADAVPPTAPLAAPSAAASPLLSTGSASTGQRTGFNSPAAASREGSIAPSRENSSELAVDAPIDAPAAQPNQLGRITLDGWLDSRSVDGLAPVRSLLQHWLFDSSAASGRVGEKRRQPAAWRAALDDDPPPSKRARPTSATGGMAGNAAARLDASLFGPERPERQRCVAAYAQVAAFLGLARDATAPPPAASQGVPPPPGAATGLTDVRSLLPWQRRTVAAFLVRELAQSAPDGLAEPCRAMAGFSLHVWVRTAGTSDARDAALTPWVLGSYALRLRATLDASVARWRAESASFGALGGRSGAPSDERWLLQLLAVLDACDAHAEAAVFLVAALEQRLRTPPGTSGVPLCALTAAAHAFTPALTALGLLLPLVDAIAAALVADPPSSGARPAEWLWFIAVALTGRHAAKAPTLAAALLAHGSPPAAAAAKLLKQYIGATAAGLRTLSTEFQRERGAAAVDGTTPASIAQVLESQETQNDACAAGRSLLASVAQSHSVDLDAACRPGRVYALVGTLVAAHAHVATAHGLQSTRERMARRVVLRALALLCGAPPSQSLPASVVVALALLDAVSLAVESPTDASAAASQGQQSTTPAAAAALRLLASASAAGVAPLHLVMQALRLRSVHQDSPSRPHLLILSHLFGAPPSEQSGPAVASGGAEGGGDADGAAERAVLDLSKRHVAVGEVVGSKGALLEQGVAAACACVEDVQACCGRVLADGVARLALLEALLPQSAAATLHAVDATTHDVMLATKVLPARCVLLSLLTASLITMDQCAEMRGADDGDAVKEEDADPPKLVWQRSLSRCFDSATETSVRAHLVYTHLILEEEALHQLLDEQDASLSDVLERMQRRKAAPEPPHAAEAALAAALAAAMLRRPARAPLLLQIAATQSGAALEQLFALLEGGLHDAPGPPSAGLVKLLLGMASLGTTLAARLPPALLPIAAAQQTDAYGLESAFADVFITALCSLDSGEWKRQAELLVQQVALLAEALQQRAHHGGKAKSSNPGMQGTPEADGAAEATGEAKKRAVFGRGLRRKASISAVASDLNLSDASFDPAGCQLALWLRLEVLLPLMPLVYNDKSAAGLSGKNLRCELAIAVLTILLHFDQLMPAAAPPGGPELQGIMAAQAASQQTLPERLLLLLHTLVAEDWASWLKCHQAGSAGRLKPVGPMPQLAALRARLRSVPLPAAIAVQLQAAQAGHEAPVQAAAAAAAPALGPVGSARMRLHAPHPTDAEGPPTASASPAGTPIMPPLPGATSGEVAAPSAQQGVVDPVVAWEPWELIPMPRGIAVWDAERQAFKHAQAHPCLAGAKRVRAAGTRFFKST